MADEVLLDLPGNAAALGADADVEGRPPVERGMPEELSWCRLMGMASGKLFLVVAFARESETLPAL